MGQTFPINFQQHSEENMWFQRRTHEVYKYIHVHTSSILQLCCTKFLSGAYLVPSQVCFWQNFGQNQNGQ